MLIEIGVVLLAALLALVLDITPNGFSGDLVIALLAFGMGVRNATVRRVKVADLTTTVLTMTLTGLAADSPLAGGDGKGSGRRTVAVLAMLLGAIAGALLLKVDLALVMGLVGAGIALSVPRPGARRRCGAHRAQPLAHVERFGAFDLDRFEGIRVKAEQAQDRWCDLRRLDRLRADGGSLDRAAGDDQRHLAVLRVGAAVLGDLALLAGVDDPVLADPEEIGDARVADRGAGVI